MGTGFDFVALIELILGLLFPSLAPILTALLALFGGQ